MPRKRRRRDIRRQAAVAALEQVDTDMATENNLTEDLLSVVSSEAPSPIFPEVLEKTSEFPCETANDRIERGAYGYSKANSSYQLTMSVLTDIYSDSDWRVTQDYTYGSSFKPLTTEQTSSRIGDRSGIYIPPPLRNRQFNMAEIDMPWREHERREFLETAAMPPTAPPNIRFGWTPWESFDFLSDLLKSSLSTLDLNDLNQRKKEVRLYYDHVWSPIPFEDYADHDRQPWNYPSPRIVETDEDQEHWWSCEEQLGGGEEIHVEASSATPSTRPPSEPEPSYSAVLKSAPPPQPPPLPMKATCSDTSRKPEIRLIPVRATNFTKVPIQFTIQLINISQKCNPEMFSSVAVTPSGSQRIECHIRWGKSKDKFQGCFTATGEVGHYTVKVTFRPTNHPPRLLNKMKAMGKTDMDFVVEDITDSLNILVSRNYYRESLIVPSNSIKLDYIERAYDADPITGNAWGLTCDRHTNKIFYTEAYSNCITCVDPEYSGGKLLYRINRGQDGIGAPVGICCDEYNRRLIVCEWSAHRVSFFGLDTAEYITSFGIQGIDNGMFNMPWDVDVSARGSHIVVTDSGNNRIQLFDGYGNFLNQYPAQNPRGVCFDSNDSHQIYVTNYVAGTLTEILVGSNPSNKKIASKAGKYLRSPQGIVSDGTGGLLIADAKVKCVRHLNANSDDENILLSTISKVGRDGLKCPLNLAMMPKGHVAALEGNGNVYIF